MTTAEKLTTIAENVPKVYEAGKNDGYNNGYNSGYAQGKSEGISITNVAYFCYGGFRKTELLKLDTSKYSNFSGVFGKTSWTTMPLIDTSNGTNFTSMFEDSSQITTIPEYSTSKGTNFRDMFQGCSKITTIPQLDTSKGTNFSYMFSNCQKLQKIPQINTSKGTSFSYMFNQCRALTTLPEIVTTNGTSFQNMFYYCIALTTIKLDLANGTSVSGMFNYCTKLQNLTLLNIKTSLTVGSGSTYGHLLTVDSLVGLIYQLRDVGATKTLTIGTTNKNKLTSTYVKLIDITDGMRAEDEYIDEKLPFVVCNSTDEDAILITDYVALKNWKLA